MELIRNWAMALSMVIVFAAIVESIAPHGAYRKYIHLVLAVLMLISITEPLIRGKVSFPDLTAENGYYSSDETERARMEFKQQKDVIEIFKRTLEENLKTRIETMYPELEGRCSVEITADQDENNFGSVTNAAVFIQPPSDTDTTELKRRTAEILGISEDKVTVVIGR